MHHRTTFPHSITVEDHMQITMPDGVKLSARLWLPDDARHNPVPLILEHLPYRKRDGTIVRDEYSHPWMAGHGYAVLRTDMRGSGDSEGLMDDEYTAQEWADAITVMEWACAQPWCSGSVGMMGISWGGFNSLQLAALAPPMLKAVITLCSTVDRYADDIHYKGGCLLLENFGWAANMLSYSSRPPDPVLVGDGWVEMWKKRLHAQPWDWSTWMRHQNRDAYWKHGSICEDYSAVNAAILSIGGWHDGYRNTPAHLAANLSGPVKAIVGPWNHKYPHYAGPQPAIGFLQEAKRWWDHWLKGEDTGVDEDPAMRVWQMDSIPPKRWVDKRPGRWVALDQWPSPRLVEQEFYLAENRTLNLEQAPPFHAQISTPQDCGQQSGEYFPFAFSDELPDEQSIDDEVCACFDSPVMKDNTSIIGAPRIQLTLASDQPEALVAVRLCDLRPDGTSAFITAGFLNLTHRNGHETPEALSPDQPIDIEVVLDQIAFRLPKGHRLRLAISNSYWPFVWPSKEQGVLTLFGGSLKLPVDTNPNGRTDDEWTFEQPEAAPRWRAEALREGMYERKSWRDETSGIMTTRIICDNGENRDLTHGLHSGSKFEEQFYIHPDDPLSARATAKWQQTGGREGAMWETRAKAEMTCDATHFHSSARLVAKLNGDIIFERDFADSVERQLV